MKRTYITALFCFFTFSVFAQKDKEDSLKFKPYKNLNFGSPTIADLLPNLTPQAPNTAALGKFVEYPVNLSTGLPTISIPIYDIKVGKITVPIALKYHASGIKVTDIASSVGLGWALEAGGQISRSSIGRDDELGYLSNGIPDFSSYTTACSLRSELSNYTSGVFDDGADIFNYSLLDGTGRFILKPEVGSSRLHQQPYVLPDERIKVEYVRTGATGTIQSFSITDLKGIKYTFAVTESLNGPRCSRANILHLNSFIG